MVAYIDFVPLTLHVFLCVPVSTDMPSIINGQIHPNSTNAFIFVGVTFILDMLMQHGRQGSAGPSWIHSTTIHHIQVPPMSMAADFPLGAISLQWMSQGSGRKEVANSPQSGLLSNSLRFNKHQ